MKLLLLLALASPLAGQLTTVSQLVTNGDGSAFTGEVVIQVPPFSSRSQAVRSRDIWLCSSNNVITGCAQQIVNGVLTVELQPNNGGSPAGTSYFVSYYPDVPPGRRPSVKTEYWVVPTGGPYTIDQVRVSTPPVPTVQVNPSQLNPSGYTAGQYPCLQAGAFAPCGPTTGATWGDITGTLANQSDLAAALAGKAPAANGIVPVIVDPAPNPFDSPTACTGGTNPQINTRNGRLWICVGSQQFGFFWAFVNNAPISGYQALTPAYPSQSGFFIATSDGSEVQSTNNCAVWRVTPGLNAILGGGGSDIDCIKIVNGTATFTGSALIPANNALNSIFANHLQWDIGLNVSQLGTCNSANERTTRYVIDANSPTFLGAVTGGGSTKTPVVCNGSAWVAF